MSIPLTGTGGLFTRLGLIFGIHKSYNTYRGTTIPGKYNTLQAQFTSTDQYIIDSMYSSMSTWQGTFSTSNTYLNSLAQSVLTQMVNDDAGIVSSSLSDALKYLIAQMGGAGQSVQSCTVSATPSAGGSNKGSGFLIASLLEPTSAATLQNVFNETLVGSVTQDAQTGGLVAGRETLTFAGNPAAPDNYSWLYPAGSGISLPVTAVGPTPYSGSDQSTYLYNGDFENFTVSNVPDNWTIGVGSAGSTVLKSSSVYYDGAASLNFAGNGSELTTVYQVFNSATGATTNLQPSTVYAFNAFVRVDSTPAAGVLEFALTDGSGTILQDAASSNLSVTKNLTSVSTSWVAVNGFFRTPRYIPSTTWFRVRLSTALSNSKNVYIDRLTFAEAYQAYQGGPYMAAISGNTPFIDGDTLSLAVANNYGGQFQGYFDRFFGMKALGLQLPYSGSPTISDSLIS